MPTSTPARSEPIRITLAEERIEPRISSGLASLDRVLGGGFVVGSILLLGGEPGIGKSTLLAQSLANASKLAGKRALYATGEESITQAAMRARRVGAAHDDIWIVNETSVEWVIARALELRPIILAVDSVQTLGSDELDAAAGSLAAIRGVTARLMEFAKHTGIIVILIGHVTKDGDLAGPKTLEHLVDATLQLDLGEYEEGRYRYLRAHKNRFGSTTEVGAFEMVDTGMLDADEQKARTSDRELALAADAEALTDKAMIAKLRKALGASINTWCPRDPGGDGADGETYRLALATLEESS